MLLLLAIFLFSSPARAAVPPAYAPPPVMFDTSGTAAAEAVPAEAASGESNPFEEKEGETKPQAPSIKEEALIASSMQVAYQLYHAEDYQGSAAATQQILERYPKRDLLDTRYLLGLSLEHSRGYKEAIAVYQSIVKKSPRNTYAHAAVFRVGMCYAMMEDIANAIHTFRDIIDFNPKSQYRMQAYIHLGNLYRRQTQWKLAENIYRDVARLYPCTTWSTTAAQYLAECFVHQKEVDLAIKLYSRIQKDECTPRFMASQAQLHIGDLYMNQNRFQEAIKAYFQAIRDYSDMPGVSIYAEQKIDMAKQNRNSIPDAQTRRRNIDIRQRPED